MTGNGEGIHALARELIYPERLPLEIAARHLEGEPLPAGVAVSGSFEPFRVGQRWGGMWSTTWFRCGGKVPPDWAGREVVALVHLGGDEAVGFSAEGLIWSPDLRPLHGLHHEHREHVVSEQARPGPVEFYIEAAANPIPPWSLREWPRLDPDYSGPRLYALEQAELATVDRAAEALYLDIRVVDQLAECFPDRAEDLRGALEEAFPIIATGAPGALTRARALLHRVLEARGRGRGPDRHTIVAVGHAHIDSAWLWPVRETRRKCARTFANQLSLMERCRDHRFACSQAVQYQWIKDGYPDLYDRIRARVAEGRWEPVGGMWVEADTNIPSGESLVRQFLHGKRFFLEEFGVETAEMWLPDVFGYSAALPQIAVQAGITALITQKMSWNDTNRFPHSTFWWEGHDGSRVLAHFPPADTYNGEMGVAELLKDQSNFREGDAGRSTRTLYPFGFGDGGGGPTSHMIGHARRLADQPGLPKLELGSAGGFLEALRAEVGPALPTWVGELYLEAHRATSTTHADVKSGNRRGEEALRAAEMWCVAAGLDRRGALDPLWKALLFNQFHDILPGSSIAWVYEDAARDHAVISTGAGAVIDEAQSVLAAAGGGVGTEMAAFNPSSYDRAEVIETPRGLVFVEVPGCGWAPATGAAERRPVDVQAGEGFIDNGILRVAYDADGLLGSVWDHEAGREVLAPGERGNLLQLHVDTPRAFDAWDVDQEYLQCFEDITALDDVDILTAGPLRAEIRFRRRFGNSSLVQTLRLDAGSRRVEFHTEVDWHESHRFLKVAFPVAVRSTRATYEIQHGHIERPTVANTSWDQARFEVCGHRWADLSEPGYGVALLNDCKYGYDIRGHTMRLSLLRAPGYPDPDADRGRHRFAYALLPHPGDLRQRGRVVEEAEAFNLPITIRAGRTGATGRVVRVDRPGVSVEALKWAEDGDGLIVRLCEVYGSRGTAVVSLAEPFHSVECTDLLERPVRPIDHEGAHVVLELRPFELVTLRFRGPSPRTG